MHAERRNSLQATRSLVEAAIEVIDHVWATGTRSDSVSIHVALPDHSLSQSVVLNLTNNKEFCKLYLYLRDTEVSLICSVDRLNNK